MTPSFVEELFLRIEERLNSLENDMHEMRVEMSHLNEEIQRCAKFSAEMENVRRYIWFGRGIVLAVWGFVITIVNVLIGKWLD